MKTQLLSLGIILSTTLTACSKPPVDCDAFALQENSDYVLPYQTGESYEVLVSTGHYTKANQGVGLYAVDFVMPIGTKVVAARDGEVVSIRELYEDYNGEDLKENYIFIRHNDGTIARYFHLTHKGVLVNEGDEVKAGDVIGRSGNTGQSGGPHLHFDVQKCGPNLPPEYNKLPCGQTLPVTFRNTRPHECGLTIGEHYLALKD
ncbi:MULTISPECIES: M23 family metallopeptidase [Pseudoalteromonas]|uniref:Metalloendopeptidase n=1 Tax=Pseudoalteromonas amylolytica TaxID=1859457 RepID=A0A1S1MVN9_9GAMM|nr:MULTISPECIES: M23 family metallopeptidase [Pseudoalteromonas]OHU85432.1 metalloendopeptidase [Pseudoalteromonas sp. JW3]OHU92947.1 metalloendopeptidase [Pseudoalteromonas amylolytica]